MGHSSAEYAVVVCEWGSWAKEGMCVSEGSKQMIF